MAVLATAFALTLILWPKSLLPASKNVPRLFPHSDKAIHLFLFGSCSLLWMAALGRRGAGAVVLGGLAFAVGTELLQASPSIRRDPDPLDALADFLGVISVVWIATVLSGNRAAAKPDQKTVRTGP